MNEPYSEPANLFPRRVGEKLAEARRARGIDLAEVAAQTRIPTRHLAAIEGSDYSALPAAAYAVGFVRTYAGFLGLDAPALAREYRGEIDGGGVARPVTQPFEPVDPARVPSKLLAFIALAVALLILGAFGLWRSGLLSGEDADWRASVAAGTDQGPPPAPGGAPVPQAAPPATGGAVVITAIEPVWLRITDGDQRLVERSLAAGETYAVSSAARDPRILTGRPQAIRVTVGTTVIPPLGDPERTIRDVSLLPAALLARLNPPAAPAPVPAASPSPLPTPAPTSRAPATVTQRPASRPAATPSRTPAPVPSPAAAPPPIATAPVETPPAPAPAPSGGNAQ